jgi:hypothetical protein
MPHDNQTRMMYALLREGGAITTVARHQVLSAILGTPVTSTKLMDVYDIGCAVDVLAWWKRHGRLNAEVALRW